MKNKVKGRRRIYHVIRNYILLLIYNIFIWGCTSSDTVVKRVRAYELSHSVNIVRVRHFEEATNSLVVVFSHHSPAYFWYRDSMYNFNIFVKVIDVAGEIVILPYEYTDWEAFNLIEDPVNYRAILPEVLIYFSRYPK